MRGKEAALGRWCGLSLVGIAAVSLHGCGGGCDQETIDHATSFIAANQACETDADCVVIGDYCEELAGGFCGQLSMNRAGSETAEWKALTAELEDCGPDGCTQCAAALVPTCAQGACSRP